MHRLPELLLGLLLVSTVLIGGIMNRVRGGWGDWPINKIWHPLAYGLLFGVLFQLSLYQIILLPLAVYIGQQPGWGRYIGALSGTEKKPLEEFWLVDFFIKPLRFSQRLWGITGMTLRGLFFAGPAALILGTPWPAIAGLLMGFIYLSLIEFNKLLFPTRNWKMDGWEQSEVAFGCVFWGLTFYGLMW